MALFFADLVREVSRGTGAGALALEGAVPGYRSFAAVPAGARFHYSVAGVTRPEEWEVGEGEVSPGGALLRAPLASSAGGALVDFSDGLKMVALTVASAWFDAMAVHGHGIADVAGLEAALATVKPHGHGIADVAGLQAALDAASATAPLPVALDAIGQLVPGTDKVPFFTGTGTAALATITSFGRSLMDDPGSFAARATLQLGTAATAAIGTAGAAVPQLNNANSWSAAQGFAAAGAPVTLNATNSAVGKIVLQDAGTNRSAIGCSASYGLAVLDAALATVRFSVVTGAAPELHLNSVKVVGTRRTGWAAPTGTAARTAFDTATATTGELAQRLKALIDDLSAHGLIGA